MPPSQGIWHGAQNAYYQFQIGGPDRFTITVTPWEGKSLPGLSFVVKTDLLCSQDLGRLQKSSSTLEKRTFLSSPNHSFSIIVAHFIPIVPSFFFIFCFVFQIWSTANDWWNVVAQYFPQEVGKRWSSGKEFLMCSCMFLIFAPNSKGAASTRVVCP